MDWTVLAVMAGVLLAGQVFAREIVVSPTGKKGELGEALGAAAEGDTIRVTKGVYAERVVITKRVAVVGEAGAVLDPSEPFAPEWKPAALGKGVYQAAVAKKPQALFLDGKVLAEIDEKRTQKEGPWFWKTLLTTGTERTGYKQVRGVWMYAAEEKVIYVHLADDVDPAKLNWSTIWTREPVVAFRGATGASVSGLTIAHGFIGVELDEKSRECVVEKCVIGPWEKEGGVAYRRGLGVSGGGQ